MPFSNQINEQYPTGPAALFATHAREPIYEGQACYVCGKREGEMVFAGYDEVLGECWVHPACQKRVDEAIVKATQAEAIGAVHFICALDCRIGGYALRQGDKLTIRWMAGRSLWAISRSRIQGREIAYLNAHDVNRLAGHKILEEG